MSPARDVAPPRRLSGFTDFSDDAVKDAKALGNLTKRQFDELFEHAERLQHGPGTGAVRQTVDGNTRWSETPDETNRVMIFNPENGLWEPSTMRERSPDNRYNPIGKWNLSQQSFADSSGYSQDLTLEVGTERWSYVTPTLGGFLCDGATRLIYNTASATLGTTGAVSMIAMVRFHGLPAAAAMAIGYSASTEAQADNQQWGIFQNTDYSVSFISESGLGVNATHSVNSWLTPWTIGLIGFSRSAGQIVQHYLNGRPWGAASSALTTPDGGGNARFRIGGQGNANMLAMTVAGVAVYGRDLTEEEHLERFNFCMGRGSGFIAVGV